MDKQKFLILPNEYREVPLWSWNDDLDPEELRRQIALMDEGGWGGFFMYPRVRLRMQYLGKPWFDSVRVCIEEARKRGMGAWFYDENLRINGQDDGTLAWSPHRLDIGPAVHPGDNRIEIELVGTLRNLLGPHTSQAVAEPGLVQ